MSIVLKTWGLIRYLSFLGFFVSLLATYWVYSFETASTLGDSQAPTYPYRGYAFLLILLCIMLSGDICLLGNSRKERSCRILEKLMFWIEYLLILTYQVFSFCSIFLYSFYPIYALARCCMLNRQSQFGASITKVKTDIFCGVCTLGILEEQEPQALIGNPVLDKPCSLIGECPFLGALQKNILKVVNCMQKLVHSQMKGVL